MNSKATMLLLSALMGCTLGSFADEPAGSQTDKEEELERLKGTWVSTSYDYDGKSDIKLKMSEGLQLQITLEKDGWRCKHALRDPHHDQDSYGSAGLEIDDSRTPRLMILGADSGSDKHLAYEIKGDQMRLRDLSMWHRTTGENDPAPADLTAKKGDKWIIFNLKRRGKDKAPAAPRQQ